MSGMLRLTIAELRQTASVWAGVAAVTMTAGYATGLVGSLVVTAGDLEGTSALALYGISGTALAFTAIAVVVTVTSVTELTLALLRGRFVLWLLAGVTPTGLTIAVLVQLVVVAFLGASTGALLAGATASRVVGAALAPIASLDGVDAHLGGPGALVATGVVVALAGYAGLRPVARAGRTVGGNTSADRPASRRAMGAGRWAVAGLATAALASVVTTSPGADDPGAPLLLVAPLAAAILTAVGPVFVARWVRFWTHLVARDPLPTWFLARAQAIELLTRSTGPIGPLLLTIALTGGLWSVSAATVPVGTVGRTGAADVGGLLVVLAAPLVVTLVGSAVTVAMLDRERAGTAVVAEALGTTRRQAAAVAVGQVTIIVATSAALATVCVGLTVLTAAWSLGPEAALAATPATIAASGAAAVVCLAIQVAAVLPSTVLDVEVARDHDSRASS